MKRYERMKSWGMGVLLACLLLWGTTLQAGVPPAWKDGGYSMEADNMTVRAVLEEFGRTYGVRVQMSSGAARRVKGRLKADSGLDFLNRLAASHNLRWFVYNATLYVGAGTDNTSERMQVGENAVQDAKSALVGLGLFDERFGWGELPDEGVVIVSGPRAYVELTREVLMPIALKDRVRGRQVMLFRLKYASAMDRTINSRGKTETIAGIRTILSNLMLGPHGGTGEKVTGPGGFDAASAKRSRTGPNGRGESRQVGQEAGPAFVPLFAAPGANGRNPISGGGAGAVHSDAGGHSDQPKDNHKEPPRIEADPTLNAIMIYDDVAKRDMYEKLIKQLDVKPRQVEIEALIVDIERSKLAEIGLEWGVRAGTTNAVVNGTGAESSGIELPLQGATLLISNVARFYARLKAMESRGEARVLATPSVLTLDNVAAVLDLSQTAYVSLVGERVADMSDITAGTMLRVIPRIIDDDGNIRVRLEVDIEDGSLNTDSNAGGSGKSGSASAGLLGTSVTRSTINTQAIIDAQQTLVIGGYRAESLMRNRQKVPVLGDLPVFGGLFRSETKSNSTRERLFLITPRITGFDGTRVNTTPVRATPASAPVSAAASAPALPAAARVLPLPRAVPLTPALPPPVPAAAPRMPPGAPRAFLPGAGGAADGAGQEAGALLGSALPVLQAPVYKAKTRCLRRPVAN